jgi:ornithine carbamoyltransferase
MKGGAMLGMDLRIGAPRSRWPADELVASVRALAGRSGARLTRTEDPREAATGADHVYTDVWVWMGEPKEAWAERIALLLLYQVDAALMAATGNPATRLHRLPAFHGRDTTLGQEILERFGLDAMEVTDEVFESPASIVFDQAENRMHTIKALLVASLA